MSIATHRDAGDPLYSLAHLTLINCTPAELVYIAARAGYDAVSPRFITMNVPGEFTHSPLDKAQVQATKTALETTGLQVLDIELARITEDCDPRDFEANYWNKAYAREIYNYSVEFERMKIVHALTLGCISLFVTVLTCRYKALNQMHYL